MNPNDDPPAPEAPSPEGKAARFGGIDPGELLARALNTAQPSVGATSWLPPTVEELAHLLPQYRIEALLGRGGMGAVYRGVQPDLDRPVAIKLLPAEMAAAAQFIDRFRREARLLGKLQHPGIVTIHDFGQTAAGHLFFVMEYVDGTDLQHILQTGGVNPAQALELIVQICEALQYAHSRGVIHRDIKPANILLTQEGRAKLADFGLARPVQADTSALTSTNVVMGTDAYMAPEQRTGHADERADIYALGVMLYEMLTGQRPHGVFDPPSRKVQVDVRLDSVVLKALQEEPDRRYQHASEMKTDVDHIRTTVQQSEPAPKRKTKALIVAGVIVASLAVLGATGFFLWKEGDRSASAAIAPTPAGVATSSEPILDEEGFASLFNGHDLTGWAGIPQASVKNGAIVIEEWTGMKANRLLRTSGHVPNDFELRVKVRTTKMEVLDGGNVMIEYRPQTWGCLSFTINRNRSPDVAGVSEIRNVSKILAPAGCEAIAVYDSSGGGLQIQRRILSEDAVNGLIKFDDWNDVWIIVRGNTVEHYVNARQFAVLHDDRRLDRHVSGHYIRLGVWTSGNPLVAEFKDIRIKDLTGIPQKAPSRAAAVSPSPSSPLSQPSPATASKDAPFVNSLGMKLVPVPETTVLFSIYETRVKDYTEFAKAKKVDGTWQTKRKVGLPVSHEPEYPVCAVDWDEATAFCMWLTEKETTEGKLPKGAKYRLPTDEEWSHAVGLPPEQGATPAEKSGKNSVDFPWGLDYPPPKEKVGNYADQTWHKTFPDDPWLWIPGYTDGYATTAPVGSFPANAAGLYDMGGNVSEWCEDWFDASQKNHLLRGASWNLSPRSLLLSSAREGHGPTPRSSNIGFRCVLAPAL